ncbi:MAG: hypothetical protein LBL21_04645 [Rickettsiales bacterium]|jgi:hypothetical protein|nr:hypothetical protein [Rickettsiales bacterium]
MKLAGFIGKIFNISFGAILASACVLLSAHRAGAAVGLCVRDDSLAKVAAVNAGDAEGGWDGGWGNEWEVLSTNGQYAVSGIAACLGAYGMSGDKPSSWSTGRYCWCRVTGINNKKVSGAWVFHLSYGDLSECGVLCGVACSNCVRYGTDYSCTRSALFAPL